jgi:transcriptional regulator with XRE-family HTH domain
MSPELPPADAPFPDRLAGAMALSDYKTGRKLAAALGTDGGLVSKWLKGTVSPSARHRAAMQRLLPVPAGYFAEDAREDRLLALAASDAETKRALEGILADLVEIRTRLEQLESVRTTAPTPARRRRQRPA